MIKIRKLIIEMELQKEFKSEFGSFEFETPRDRNGEFEPKNST